ncbi:MAG: putative addiction module antidote protein [Alphaproteobacteria bacterium]|nr:putative addiction module antidote protein [Alphaproteobacteria bacterium]
MSKSIPYKDYLKETLKDPQEAAAYLDEALKDNDPSVFTLALRDVVDACGGGITETARKTSLNREGLYRMLSEKGNPRFKSLNSLIDSLGLELHVMVKSQEKNYKHSSKELSQ